MRGSAPLPLHEGCGIGDDALGFRGDIVLSGTDDHGGRGDAGAPTASSTCASSDFPAIACSTLGRAERMRVPSPAASTIARQALAFITCLSSLGLHLLAFIANSGALLGHDPEKWKPVSRLREARFGGRRKVGQDHAQQTPGGLPPKAANSAPAGCAIPAQRTDKRLTKPPIRSCKWQNLLFFSH